MIVCLLKLFIQFMGTYKPGHGSYKLLIPGPVRPTLRPAIRQGWISWLVRTRNLDHFFSLCWGAEIVTLAARVTAISDGGYNHKFQLFGLIQARKKFRVCTSLENSRAYTSPELWPLSIAQSLPFKHPKVEIYGCTRRQIHILYLPD